jgi:hypothetical protein
MTSNIEDAKFFSFTTEKNRVRQAIVRLRLFKKKLIICSQSSFISIFLEKILQDIVGACGRSTKSVKFFSRNDFTSIWAKNNGNTKFY